MVTVLTPRFGAALAYACELHAGQPRKRAADEPTAEIPYVSHLLAVAALVLEHGGDEDEGVAALLHDGPEDQGGRATLEEIRRRFGERVAGVVEAMTDTFESPKPAWGERKRAYVRHLREGDPDDSALLVCAADKVHNVASILRDHRRIGARVWKRFTGDREGTLWYYTELLAILRERQGERWGALVDELERLLGELRSSSAGEGRGA